MASLTEFLLARIAEDEDDAKAASSDSPTWAENGTWWLEGVEHNVVGNEEAFCHPENVRHIARHDPARVLAECAAKRRIIELHPCDVDGYCGDGIGLVGCRWLWPCPTLSALSLPYVDRPRIPRGVATVSAPHWFADIDSEQAARTKGMMTA